MNSATGKTSSKAAKHKQTKRKATKRKVAKRKVKTTKRKVAKRKAKTTKRKAAKRKPRRRVRPDPEHVAEVVRLLAEWMPAPRCALDHANPFELTAATILSAQCTDERVNMVTPALFARWPDAASMAAADPAEMEETIHSTGFFRNKTKSLLGMSRRVRDQYGGNVPRDMKDLMTLPGVARKTANVVRGVIWGLADGVVVDTHVSRIAQRLGFTRETDPIQIERDLMDALAPDEWIDFSHRIIHLGRRICDARKPRCLECFLADGCPRVGVLDGH